MDFREWKLELSIVATAVALLFAMLSLFKAISPSSQLDTKEIVYEMPRPMSPELEVDFDLAQREITREYINSQLKGGARSNKPVAGIPVKTPAKKDKKTDSNKKTAQTASRKSQLKIEVISAKPDSKMTSRENSSAARVANYFQNNNNIEKDQAKEPLKDEEDKKVMTLEEWRQLLLAQPNLVNMNKFVAAYREKEVSPLEFYQLSQELIMSNKKESQAAGLYALQSVPSATSFAMITKNLSKLDPETRITGQKILLSYSEPQKLGYLSQALQSTDPEVVKQAADTITYGLAQIKRSQPPQVPRGSSGEVTVSSTLQPYSRFLQIFETWRQSGDQTLMGLAQNFLSTWNS